MGLNEYRRRRNFAATDEPKGGEGRSASKRLVFVVQKHAASHLHYDLRLEIDGVLKSWAVPKGPSLNPQDKRLAVQVEDHPIEYANFEGAIPEGNYGAGSVIVWDRGTWEPLEGNPSLDEGRLTFRLDGHKLKGSWSLIRMGKDARNRNWLLVKHDDQYASTESAITQRQPQSVSSGLQIEEIIAQNRGMSRKKRPATGGAGERRRQH